MQKQLVGPANGRSITGDLSPNQIKWLRANIRPFNAAWKAVRASDMNAARVRSRLIDGIDVEEEALS